MVLRLEEGEKANNICKNLESKYSKQVLDLSTPLEWKEWPPLPVKMADAQSVWLNGTLHVGGGVTSEGGRADARLYSLRPGVDSTWAVADTPTSRFALVVHNSELLLVGGREYPTGEKTNKVFTMTNRGFHDSHPPMKEVRCSPAAVSNGSALVVAGGWGIGESNYLSSVELLKDGQWKTAPPLPRVGSDMKSALHGDLWYIIHTKGVFRVSLQLKMSGTDSLPWESMPGPPNNHSAIAFFGGHLLSIGGGEYGEPTTAIHVLSSSSQSWEYVADLPVPVRRSSAVILPTGKLLSIGGKDGKIAFTSTVYEAFLRAPLVGFDVPFSLSKLNMLQYYGVNLMEALYNNRYRFHITSEVRLLMKERKKALTLPPKKYVDLIFEAWQRSKRPTYPSTWQGLYTVLRKMDLGHLVEGIAKCVTGTMPERIEDSPQPSGVSSSGDNDQGDTILSELKAEVEHLQLQNECLLLKSECAEDSLDELTDDYHALLEKIRELEKDIDHLTNENYHLRAESKQFSPLKQDVEDLYPVKPKIKIESELNTEAKRKLFLERREDELSHLTDKFHKQLTIRSDRLVDKIEELEKNIKHLRYENYHLRSERADQIAGLEVKYWEDDLHHQTHERLTEVHRREAELSKIERLKKYVEYLTEENSRLRAEIADLKYQKNWLHRRTTKHQTESHMNRIQILEKKIECLRKDNLAEVKSQQGHSLRQHQWADNLQLIDVRSQLYKVEKENQRLRNENLDLRAVSEQFPPMKHSVKYLYSMKPEIKIESSIITDYLDYQDIFSPHSPSEFISEGCQDAPSPRLPPKVKSEPQKATQNLTLPGVEVVASTSVVVTNSFTTFNWSGHGFRLTVPRYSLPAGVDHCQLDIMASTAGQYQFPDTLHLVSGVFWVRPGVPGPFRRPLTMEVQHCAKMSSSTKLSFVRAHCSQESLPYRFKEVKGHGSFSEHSSYGSLEVTHFSGYAVVGDRDVERRYTASLYYFKKSINFSATFHITVSWNDEVHILAIDQFYDKEGAKKGSFLAIQFDETSDQLSLDIPMPKGVEKDGWNIYPLIPPIITKQEVDSFKPRENVPSLQLKARALNRQQAQELRYLLKLNGAKEPKNKLLVEVELPETTHVDPSSTQQALVSSHGRVEYKVKHRSHKVDKSHSQSLTFPHYMTRQHSLSLSGPSSGIRDAEYDWLMSSSLLSGPPHPIIAPREPVSLEDVVNHVGIHRDLLEQPCSSEHIFRIAPLLPNWQKYALALGLSQQQVLNIKSDQLLDHEMKAQQVLTLWKQEKGFTATYSVLVQVCLQSKLVQQAEVICNILKESLPPSTGEKREPHTEQGSSDKRPCLDPISEDQDTSDSELD